MSKSYGNYIGVSDSPNDMFGKVMSIPDRLMGNYFTLLTELPRPRIDELLDAKRTHPRQAKALLGRMIVAQYHGEQAAEAASAEFDRVFSQRDVPTEMPEIAVAGGRIALVELIMKAGFAASNSEARRLIQQNAVSLNGTKLSDIHAVVEVAGGEVLRVGKLRFGRVRIG
jgi:tyrosyl-tRNA synthetase